MAALDSAIQILSGAAGSTAIVGYWLLRSLKKIDTLEAKIDALNAKVEARDALRLADHQGPLRDVAEALFAAGGDDREREREEPPAAPGRVPTGRHRRTG